MSTSYFPVVAKTARLSLLLTVVSLAQAQQTVPDLSDASLEQLMNVEVTSVSKKEQKISHVAAAIFVLSQEDIRRSGAASIPDLLRMVPGMDIAQTSGGSWAVSARGFNNIWANKLLVLIDGRSVYDPGFSGTLWNAQDVPLPDIERIEVIRGPGATVWGANAVNGVINIITRNSRDTVGGLLNVAAGSQLVEQTLAQYGGAIGNAGFYRFFGDSTLNRANGSNILAQPAADSNRVSNFGFRSDWKLSERDALLVEANLSSSIANQTFAGFYSFNPPYAGTFADTNTSAMGSVLAKWTRTSSPSSDTSLQFYYDHDDYASYGIHQKAMVADLDFEHHFAAGDRNDIVLGLDARLQPGTVVGGYSSSLTHPHYNDWLGSAFLQDEIKINERWSLTAGTKFEINRLLGASLQPSVRALWTPNAHNSVWFAASRALREPSREDVDVSVNGITLLPGGAPAFIHESGNPDIQAESLAAFEAGYRVEPAKRFSLDLSTFYNRYNNLTTAVPLADPFLSADPLPLHFVLPIGESNAAFARTYGAELSGVMNMSRRWKLSPGYSLLRTKFSADSPTVAAPSILQGDAPQQQFQLRSYLTLRPNLDFDAALYYVGSMPAENVPAYTRLDLRLGWRFSDSLDLSLVGQNLLGAHDEFGLSPTALAVSTYTSRTAYLRASWHF